MGSSAMAWLSEQDIYLFREGTHSTLYRRMGCQLREPGGAHFAVWAPNAREISVIGDWNHWTRGIDVLRPRWDQSGIWEADVAQSDSDFAHKISIARKEASETQYCLALIHRSKLLSREVWCPLAAEAEELVRILSVVVRKTQEHIHRG